MLSMHIQRVLFVLMFLLTLASCQQTVATLEPQIINTYPHDPEAFTQGLLIYDDDFYESTGLNGRSSLREVDIETGEVIRILPLADRYFGEGLARVNDDLIQLTWQSGEAFRYDLESFTLEETYRYDTEGWGLCYDGEFLYMTDGSATLYQRHAETFELLGQVTVEQAGTAVRNLNELECVGEYVYANVWQSDRIVQIEKQSGAVIAEIDASALSAESGTSDPNAVLNGIAYDAETDTFYLTGKLWPQMFEVTFLER